MPSVFDYAQSRETDPGFEPPRPDYGTGHAFTQAFKQGVESNFTGMGLRALKYWKLKTGAVMLPETGGGFIDKDTFDRDYSLKGALKFDAHHEGKMSRGYAQALMEDHLDDEFTKAQAGLSYAPVASFVGSLAGGLLSPVDLAVNLAIPEYTFVKFGMGASVASRAGTGVARIASRTINGAVNGTAQAIAFQLPMAALSTHNQTEYTLEDAIANIGMGPLMGGAAGLLHGTARHVAGEWDRKFANAVMHAAATDKDPSIAAKIASQDPRMAEALEQRQRLKNLVQKQDRTPEESSELLNMAGENPPENINDLLPPASRFVETPLDHVLSDAGPMIDSSTQAGPLPKKRLPYSRERMIIEDILADPYDKRIRGAASDDEKFLAEAWKTLFGVELRFVSRDLSRSMGFRGFTRPEDPSRAYITEGALNDGSLDSMMFVAGHELGHSVRLRDPGLWDDMVSAMMKTSQNDNGALAGAWKAVVHHSRGNSVWAGKSLSGKMDETFATVLGRAVQSQDFWNTLSGSSPSSANRLANYLLGLRDRLVGMLSSSMTPETKALYEGLSQAVLTSGIDEKSAQAPDSTDLVKLYSKHRPEFRRMSDRLVPEMQRRGMAATDELSRWMVLNQHLFPMTDSLEDRSQRFVRVLKNRRINSDNPGLWLLMSVFKKYAPGTDEFNTYSKWAQDVFSWDGERLMDRKSKAVVDRALTDHPQLATFKKNVDGTWDIGIHRNDDFPLWHKAVDDLPSDVELVANQFRQEQFEDVRAAFAEFVKDPTNSEKRSAISEEFDSFTHRLGSDQVHEFAYNDPDGLWREFAQHVDDKLAQYRLANDKAAYQNLFDGRKEVDVLLRNFADVPKGEVSADQVHPSNKTTLEDQSPEVRARNLKAAWDEFIKKYPELEQQIAEKTPPGHIGHAEGPLQPSSQEASPEFFERLFKSMRREVAAQLSEYTNGLVAFHRVAEGKGFEWSIIKAMVGDERFSAATEAVIDQVTKDRIREAWPHYDQVMKIQRAVDNQSLDFIHLSDAQLKDLPDDYKDANEHFDVMSDLSEGLDYMAAPTRFTAEEAEMFARTRLDREHATWSKFLTSFEPSVQARIDEGIERNKLDGWTLDPKPKPAAGAAPAPEPKGPLADAMNAVKSQYEISNKVLSGVAAGKPVKKGLEDLTRSITERFEYHLRQTTDRRTAASAVSMDLRRDAQSKLLRAIQHHEATTSLIGRAKAGLDALYSYLDGIARKDVPAAGASVAEAMSSRVVADSAPLARDLVSSGLDTLWVNNDEALMRALIGHMKGTKISADPMVKMIADTLRKTQEVQTGRLNANGANIRLLEGFVFSQVHNPYYIGRSAAEFISDVNAWLDWDATERMQGPNTPQGTFDRALYLKQLQFELAKKDRPLPAGFDPETMGGNIASSVSHRRTLHFKDTFAFDYDTKYGSGNTAGLITEQIIKRAELGTVMEHFGPDYKKTWNHVMRELGRPGEWRWSKIGRIDLTFQNLVGDLNHPEDVKIAAIGQAVRQAMNSVSLWLSGVSSVTDLGNAISTMTWMGMSPSGMNKALFSAMKDQWSKDPKNRQFLLAQGAGLQAILSAFARTQVMDGPAYRLAQRASDFTFKYNGQELWTKTLQSAFHDLTTQHLGEMAKGTTPEFINWLSHYGITVEEWKSMSQHAVEIDGLQGVRLAPDLIPNEALATKLRVAMSDSMHQAILEPTVSDRALATWGTKAGTPYGEAVRTVMQYKTYPMAMLRRVQRRFANAYGNEGLYAFGKGVNQGQLAWLTWAGSMLSLAATALAIKDLARGREPLNPFDTDQWTIGNASRIVSQAGIGPFAVAEQFLSPHQALGPAFGSAYSIGRGIATGNGYATTNAILGSTPIVAAAPIKEASKAILGSIFTEAYGVHYQQFLQQLEAETGQTSIFLDKK